ncbi:transglycosylase domain-containing protein [Alteribacillus bidgolensis]|uniref:Penicillin-binding protein, 1A family n=1 Tax=Alteribacillus bidgolensis TaxID=930129 RepID=A0A1G8LW74_9BACI|nr:PBP1A family penicillin-binding protein [Alteribacillus bidgolensis]SDI59885.1 penicillin-binding protein, 1A family [Alteribacillus bidgolensis]
MDTVIKRNQKTKKPGWFRLFIRAALLAGILGSGGALTIITSALILEPPPIQVQQSTVFYGADHSVIGEHHNGQKRYWKELDEISPEIINAVIAVEDREFYQHNGFDLPRIASAVAANIKSGSKAQGASTITQQYARNLFLTHDKTWSRKLEEAFYALRLESHYEKEEIIEGYINTIYFGHGAYGIEAASRLYFDKSSSDLSLAEASLLAGVPKGPSYYSPFSYPERAKDRQQIVLAAMETTGMITSEERQEAKNASLSIQPPGQLADDRIGPYFQDYIEHILQENEGIDPQLIDYGGLHVYTTLDPELQEKAEKWVRLEIPKDSELQGALAAIDPHSGDVRALVGGKDYDESTFNRVTNAARQPGSVLKPFLYYAALEDGFTPLTSFRSEPTEFETGENGKTYSPGNYGDIYADDFINMAEALAVSDNIFAVKTHLFLGPDALVETVKKAGIQANLDPIPSLALGTQNVRILDLAAGYSTFANGGQAVEPRFIQKITDAEGNVLMEQEQEKNQVFDPQKSYVITDMMKGMFDLSLDSYTSVTGRSISHLIDRPLAGKSGSTDYDSWMVGSAPQLTTAVWVGYDDNREMDHSNEGQISKRIWAQFMSEGLENELKMAFPPPEGIVKTEIDPETGLLGSEECGPARTVAFEKGTEPKRSCTDELEEEAKDSNTREDQKEDELPEQKEKFFDRLKKWFQ